MLTIPDSITPDMIKPWGRYSLWHQTAEGYFIGWRATHQQKYRDYAWQLVKAIDKYARVDSIGFSTAHSNTFPIDEQKDHQREWFLGATLKYLYMIFSSDQLLPSEQWVFNIAGHPLPIYGTNHHLTTNPGIHIKI